MAATGETAAGEPAKKGKGKLLLVVAAAVVLMLGGGGGAAAYFMGLLGGGSAGESHAAAMAEAKPGGEEAAHGEAHGPPGVAFVDMPDLIVNLQSGSPRLRYLKLRLSLEVADEPAAATVRQLMPRVLDGFQLYLRALTLDDVQGATGMQRLKEELTARVNLAVAPVAVTDVLLKEMLVQ
jgi:flagellar protein FliL